MRTGSASIAAAICLKRSICSLKDNGAEAKREAIRQRNPLGTVLEPAVRGCAAEGRRYVDDLLAWAVGSLPG